MNKSSTSLLLLILAAAPLASAQQLAHEQWDTLQHYCTKCHNYDDYSGGFAFEQLSPTDLQNDAARWEKIVRKLRGGMMPPPGEQRPSPRELTQVIGKLEGALDATAALHPNAGSVVLHRMNRAEYANAIRDLLALPVKGEDLMPPDDSTAGFDNIASVLSLSPALMQSYVTAAAKISRLAIGDMTNSAGIVAFSPPAGVSQSVHVDGLPLGTRGGLQVQHVFPLDGSYEFVIRKFAGSNFVIPPVGQQDPVEVAIDGVRVGLLAPDKPARLTLPVKAGTHTIGVAFLHTAAEQDVDDVYAVHAGSTTLGGFDLRGPIQPSGPGDTESRHKIFVCYPKEVAEQDPCAHRILETLATRAWRAPVTAAAVDDLMHFYRQGLELRGFDTGVQYALARVLSDPRFIYRFEHEPETLAAGSSYALDQYELASRLSFFLWSSIPDEELLRAAGKAELSQPKKLAAQVERMLNDARADALVRNFAAQWLGLRALATINPTSRDYDGTLRESMRKETELLFNSILRENRSMLDLINADYTFVDERLAKHYGIPHIQGSQFRRITVADPSRRGLLGQASILTLTSAPNRTSPVKRGAWILENILGTPPPPPPPGVEVKLDQPVAPGSAPVTLRQRMEQHRSNPSCGGCHGMIDPIGFALENFDSIGMWRDTTAGQRVDAATTLWDGTKLNGAASLRQALLARGDDFAQVAIEKLLAYGVGRKVEYYDMPTVRAIAKSAKATHYRLHDLIQGVVASEAFRMRVKPGTTTGPAVAQER